MNRIGSRVLTGCFSLFLISIAYHFALAGDERSRSNAAGSEGAVTTPLPGTAGGGGAMADFGTLMNLIENTVEPDSWTSTGGTSVMLPYPAGVWVDPQGQLKRTTIGRFDEQHLQRLLQAGGGQPADSQYAWHQSSPLRMVSLRQLDQILFQASIKGSGITPEAIRLAGLNQVLYVLVDLAAEDIVLAGPANGFQNGFFLEDLAVVAALIRQQTAAFGCSIEPVHENLLRTQQYITSATAQKQLSQSPDRFVKKLEQIIGRHEAQVFGMSSRTSTAVALLAADEHMKLVGFGKAQLPINVSNYFDFLEREATIPQKSLVRWWFDYTDQPISVNRDQNLFRLPANCVGLFSEQQFLTQQGRQATGQKDPSAEAFAREFSQHLGQLRELDSNYSRTCCVFEIALALQVALESSKMPDYRAWFPTLCGLGQVESSSVPEPQSVNGLSAWHYSKSKRSNIAIVSGGVQVNPTSLARSDNWQVSELLTGSVVPQPKDSLRHSQWWWD